MLIGLSCLKHQHTAIDIVNVQSLCQNNNMVYMNVNMYAFISNYMLL